jgi:predicted naringenin-chalcone synthase
MNEVYIVDTATHFPQSYNNNDIVAALYKRGTQDEAALKLAKKLAVNSKIKSRNISVKLEKLPLKVIPPENAPIHWLKELTKKITTNADLSKIKFVSLSYNISSHQDVIPTLVSKYIKEANITTDFPPEEIVNYGCASAIFSLASAYSYCKNHSAHALVFSFEQSSWIFNPIKDTKNANFKSSLRGHTIFGDGSAGLLLASGEIAKYHQKKIKLIDMILDFTPGDEIKKIKEDFLVGRTIAKIMPPMVKDKLIAPLLRRNNLNIADVAQWCIHQGSHKILDQFEDPNILNLTKNQTSESHLCFSQYGNISSPSCLAVLDSYFHKDHNYKNEYGIILGFGAGYYLGAVLYQWQ